MTDHEPNLLAILKKLRYDLTDMQVKVSEALRIAATLHLPSPEKHECPTCGIKLRGPLSLAEHLYHSHKGPLPNQYAKAETLADKPKEKTT